MTDQATGTGDRARPWHRAAIVLGLGLIAAPAIFQMFSRAPQGGEMIDEFRPYMTVSELSQFDGYMDGIEAAVDELETAPADDAPASVQTLVDQWPTIDDDMGGMLDVMSANLDNFAAVDALPPFPLFPWFFVAPGVLLIAFGAYGLLRRRPNPALAVIVLGWGLILAPVAFQMFERAPKGGDMLEELGPYMTADEVGAIQGYFVTLGAAEGALRNQVLPAADSPRPATESFVETWPQMANDMAPMVGVMADNLDNFAAVDALPPFPLFPWFFVAPGVLAIVFGVLALRRAAEKESA